MTTTTENPSLPSDLTALLGKLADGWEHCVTGPHTGHITVGGLSEETDGDGKRHKVSREAPVTSYMLKAYHPATRRAVRAMWVQEVGYAATGRLGPRWYKASVRKATKKRPFPITLPPLLMLADPASVALLTVLLRYKRHGWSLDIAVRGRHAKGPCECPDRAHTGEHTPRHLDAGQLTAYLTATSATDYLRQINELAAKRAATTAKAAQTRAAKRSATTELLSSSATEGEAA